VLGLLRVDPKDEEEGLDQSYHGGSAYGGTEGEKHFECVHCLASYPYKRATPVSEGFAVQPLGVAQFSPLVLRSSDVARSSGSAASVRMVKDSG